MHRPGAQRRRREVERAREVPGAGRDERLGGLREPRLCVVQGRCLALVVHGPDAWLLQDRLRDVEGRREVRARLAPSGAGPRVPARRVQRDEPVRPVGRRAGRVADVVRVRRDVRAERHLLRGVEGRREVGEVAAQPRIYEGAGVGEGPRRRMRGASASRAGSASRPIRLSHRRRARGTPRPFTSRPP